MNLHVLDASALIRLYFADGAMPAGLLELVRQVDDGMAALVAPDLIWVETAHALQRKTRREELSRGECRAVWRSMRRTPIETMPIARHVDRALELGFALNISAYDALYLALAEHCGCRLWTADADLALAAARMGIEA